MPSTEPVYQNGHLIGYFDPTTAEKVGSIGSSHRDVEYGGCGEWTELLRLPGSRFVLRNYSWDDVDLTNYGPARLITRVEAVAWLRDNALPPPPDLMSAAGLIDFSADPIPTNKPAATDEKSVSKHPLEDTWAISDLHIYELEFSLLSEARNHSSLPEVDFDLFAIHYSQEPHSNVPDQIPAITAIMVQHVNSGELLDFAAAMIAENMGIPALEIRPCLPYLEKQLLERFVNFAAARPKITWLHWPKHPSRYGFQVLAQRARVFGIDPDAFLRQSWFDLSMYLKRRYGDDFAPDPQFLNAIRLNDCDRPELLDDAATAESWRRRDYFGLLESLAIEVEVIGEMYDLVVRNEFQTAQTVGAQASESDRCEGIGCGTDVSAPSEASQPDEVEGASRTQQVPPQPSSNREPTIIAMENCQYRLDDGEPVVVDENEDNVLGAFLEHAALNLSSLVSASGVPNARKILLGLKRKYNGCLAPAIRLPGGKGKGGYYVRIRRESHATPSV